MAMETYVLDSGFDPRVTRDSPACLVRAVCSAESRMAAVTVMRRHGILGVSTKHVRRRGDDTDIPQPAPGEVWVQPVEVDAAWSMR
ncbi:MAG: hypothetical protein HGA44_08135 [Cellulomonadaceae bacterium]|nr:hypothetical protein [Cellulomonadaceae bacterium]